MENEHKRHLTFPLRLPISLRDSASHLAHEDGISLNHFISLAVAEKISRMEQHAVEEQTTFERRPKLAVAGQMRSF